MISIEDRVSKGAKLLDSFVPNWTNKIDIRDFHKSLWVDSVIGKMFNITNLYEFRDMPGLEGLVDHVGVEEHGLFWSSNGEKGDFLKLWEKEIANRMTTLDQIVESCIEEPFVPDIRIEKIAVDYPF